MLDTISQALRAIWELLLDVVAAILSVIGLIEGWLHVQLYRLGVPPPLQNVILIGVAVVLVLLAFRIFGGLIRVLLVLLLILFAVHVAMPLLHM